MAAIGISREAIPRPRADIAPSHCHHMADTVIISDDKCTNKNKNGEETTDAHVEPKSEDAKNERVCKQPLTNRQPAKCEVLSGEGKGRKKTKREESVPEQERIVNTFRRNNLRLEEKGILKEHRCILAMTRKSRLGEKEPRGN